MSAEGLSQYLHPRNEERTRRLHNSDGQPLNIYFVSRGQTGKGRSLVGESMISESLQRLGARVIHVVPNVRINLNYQLSFALYADVVRWVGDIAYCTTVSLTS